MKRNLIIITLLLLGTISYANPDIKIRNILNSMLINRVTEKIKAPNIILLDVATGERSSLNSYKGKIVFLNFWATWCPPCKEEMPSMERLNNQLKNEDFVMLAVSYEEPEIINKFRKKNKYTFPLLQSTGAEEKYGIRSIPATFIIDKKGYITAHKVGGVQWDTEESIKLFKLLAK